MTAKLWWFRPRWWGVLGASAVALLVLANTIRLESPSTVTKAQPSTPEKKAQSSATRLTSGSQESTTTAVNAAQTENAFAIRDVERALAAEDASVRDDAVAHLFPALANRDPASAARILESISDPELRTALLSALAKGWGSRQRLQALAWAEALVDSGERTTAVTEILAQISLSDPAQAVRMQQRYSDALTDAGELENLAQRWAEKDFSAALNWADSLPPSTQRDLVTARAAFVQAQQSPDEAARLVMNRIFEPAAQTEALISVLHQWAQRDSAAASAWIDQLPTGPLRDRAALELAAVSSAQQAAWRQRH